MAIAGLLLAVVLATISVSSANAQPACDGVFDASYGASVSTPAELDTAIECYNTAATATSYTIYLDADMDYGDGVGAAVIAQAGEGFELALEGNGHRIQGHGWAYQRAVLTVGGGASPVSISNVVLTADLPEWWWEVDGGRFYNGTALASGGVDTELVDSTIQNQFPIAFGVDVFDGAVTITNSMITGTSFGVWVDPGATATIVDSTMADIDYGLTVEEGGAADVVSSTITISTYEGEWGVHAFGEVSLVSSTIVGRGWSVFVEGNGAVSAESSILAAEGCNAWVTGVNNFGGCGDWVSLSPGSYSGLADNGCAVPTPTGCVRTVALDPSSNAIDNGPACSGGASFDQRGAGFPRLVGAECDAGAFETSPVFCDGLVVTINMNTNGGVGFGTIGDDVILGTPGRDTINGLPGNDTVCAGDGDDTVFAGAGDDRVLGERGSDTIYGGTGEDYVIAGFGDDQVFGQGGFDVLLGSGGNDLIRGLGGNDFIYGGRDNDHLFGNGGVDKIWGGHGLDLIWGNNQGDFLFGEGLRDIIRGGGGPDVIEGGDGNDAIYGEAGADVLTGGPGVDAFNGGTGVDTCTYVAGGETATSC